MPIITGAFIYLPILFFKDLATATAVGVGMHWCQYLAIMWTKYFRKKSLISSIESSPKVRNNTSKYIIFIFFYAFIMSSLTTIGINNQSNIKFQYNFFYLIPLTFQLYHFYIDGFIWKFSDPHIRKTVLPFIFSKVK